jgi:hypothetical protein
MSGNFATTEDRERHSCTRPLRSPGRPSRPAPRPRHRRAAQAELLLEARCSSTAAPLELKCSSTAALLRHGRAARAQPRCSGPAALLEAALDAIS